MSLTPNLEYAASGDSFCLHHPLTAEWRPDPILCALQCTDPQDVDSYCRNLGAGPTRASAVLPEPYGHCSLTSLAPVWSVSPGGIAFCLHRLLTAQLGPDPNICAS
jgi:hypothetical protein